VNSNLLHPLHHAAGAALRPVEEPSPLLTYGDVPAEYEAARRGCAVFDETDRGSVRVSGADAREFLHRLLANEVLPLGPGEGNRNLLLSPKGKVRFDLDLAVQEDGSYSLSTAPSDASGLCAALDMYLFTEDVQLEDQSESCAPLLLVGPESAALAERVLGVGAPERSHSTAVGSLEGSEVRVTRVSPYGVDALRLDAGPEHAEALWRAVLSAGARPAGRIVADIVRVEALTATPHVDITEDVYPQEARLEDAFSLSKGCYIGQEVVAKIDTYGGLNKRLCALALEHDDPVPSGTRLYRQDEESGEWRDLGVVTSWAYSFLDDNGRVLAYLKRRHQEPGTVFRLGEGPAVARVLA
jgi:aminomethyltransferase